MDDLHLTHRKGYLRGLAAGKADRLAGNDYEPRDGSTGKSGQAYGLGYRDGWAA